MHKQLLHINILIGIWHVSQEPISIRNIYLILTKLENDLDIGQFHITTKFHEDLSPFMMKTRSFDFDLFFNGPETLGIWHVFQERTSVRNIYLILTKLENDLHIGQFDTTAKFHEDILPFMTKTRSFDFAIYFLMAAKLIGIWHVFQ